MQFSNTLNIITGETGAGKSILLGALGLLLGNRADANIIKSGEKSCVVEGEFQITNYNLDLFFTDNDLDYNDNTIVRRVINLSGKSRAYINDLPVSLSTLKAFVSQLVDIHSQHQTLQIADEEFRINVCDKIGKNEKVLLKYKETYSRLKQSESELKVALEAKNSSARDKEWLLFQIEELSIAKLREGEVTELESELNELSNADEIKSALTLASETLGADENGILSALKSVQVALDRIGGVYPLAANIASRVKSSYVELKDIEDEISDKMYSIESIPERLSFVEERLNTIYTLQQKHRVQSEAELINLLDEYNLKLSQIDGSDERVKELNDLILKLNIDAKTIADKLTKSRSDAGLELSKYIESALGELGIEKSTFIVEITPSDKLRSSGQDIITILFSANKNLPARAIDKVASGGELSRVMLALKSLVAKSSKLPTIIFDEIDTGVSGQVADKIGNIVTELSNNMQVINITHLPQVASKGDTHWYVYKDNSGDTTATCIILLDEVQRVEQIAKMISGSQITQAAREQAIILLKK